jgi:glycosyltransferase involved in cell wall biosynthesis
MVKVLVIGQTPPPFGGQAIMIEKLLEAEYSSVQLFHVRMAFSKEMDEIGKFQWSKILHLISIVIRTIYFRFRYNISILYYPPAGPYRIPMYRDLAILLGTRWLFKRTVFHFHGSGISELYPQLPPILQFFFRLAYFHADAAIRLSEINPPDGQILQAKREFIVPNGIEDHYTHYRKSTQRQNVACQILFVGMLCDTKGVLILLEAAGILHRRGLNFNLDLMGRFQSEEFRQRAFAKVSAYGLEKHVTFLGVLTGEKKWEAFAVADVFCFPTFFESEAFPVVVLEAMQFELPIVATRWRGIPNLIRDGASGYLVPVRDSQAVAEKLEILIQDPNKAIRMGQKGRKRYLQNYTIDKHLKDMETVFLSVSRQEGLPAEQSVSQNRIPS